MKYVRIFKGPPSKKKAEVAWLQEFVTFFVLRDVYHGIYDISTDLWHTAKQKIPSRWTLDCVFAFRIALILCGTLSTRCWNHSSEIFSILTWWQRAVAAALSAASLWTHCLVPGTKGAKKIIPHHHHLELVHSISSDLSHQPDNIVHTAAAHRMSSSFLDLEMVYL